MNQLILKLPLQIFTLSLALLAPWSLADSRVAQEYPVKDFNEVYVGGDAHLEITQGNDEYLRVEASADVMKRVKVDLDGKKLRLSVKGDGLFSWFGGGNDEVHVVLRVKDLRYLDISGAANAHIGDLKTAKFGLDASGASNVELIGLDADSLDFDFSGASNGHLNRINVANQNYDLSGASNLDIKAPSRAKFVDLDASGASNFRGQLLTTAKAKAEASGADRKSVV